jgi:hypothetical protein
MNKYNYLFYLRNLFSNFKLLGTIKADFIQNTFICLILKALLFESAFLLFFCKPEIQLFPFEVGAPNFYLNVFAQLIGFM